IPVCAGGGGSVESLAGQRVRIWSFYNEGDKASLVEGERRMRQELLKAGASPLATEYPQAGHNSWDLAYRCIGMYHWLLDQSLLKNSRQGEFELLCPERLYSDNYFSRLATIRIPGFGSQRGVAFCPRGMDRGRHIGRPRTSGRLPAQMPPRIDRRTWSPTWHTPRVNFTWMCIWIPGRGKRHPLSRSALRISSPAALYRDVPAGSWDPILT
ncbi:MAG: hypothetical protein ACQESR_18670, partial [Planctomycetota bacterium]